MPTGRRAMWWRCRLFSSNWSLVLCLEKSLLGIGNWLGEAFEAPIEARNEARPALPRDVIPWLGMPRPYRRPAIY